MKELLETFLPQFPAGLVSTVLGLSDENLWLFWSGFWLSHRGVEFAGVVPAYTSDTTLLPNFSYSVVSQQVYQTLFQYSKVLQPEQGALI